MNKTIINSLNIGEKLSGLGRFSLLITKNFYKDYQVIINENGKVHFNDSELKYLNFFSKFYSPDYGLKGHILRLLRTNLFFSKMINLSQLEINFFLKDQLVVVHDLIPVLFPQYYKKQRIYFKYLLPFVLRRIKKIVTVSYHTKNILVEKYKLNPEKISVVHNGIIIPEFYQVKKENYILFVGRDINTKNFDRVLEVFRRIRKKYDIKLYVVGFKREEETGIKYLGYVNDKELDNLYRKAKFLLFPSLYEGFGYPVIEAMARGTAVITSNIASLPEIGGDAALYVNPYNVEEIYNTVEILLKNEHLRKKMEEKGLLQAQKFSIEKMVEKYKKVFDEFSNSSRLV